MPVRGTGRDAGGGTMQRRIYPGSASTQRVGGPRVAVRPRRRSGSARPPGQAQPAPRAPVLQQGKLRVPSVPREVVLRQRLQDSLGASPARRVTVVDAPAGFGKTTLLASWLAADQTRPCAWVSLDE